MIILSVHPHVPVTSDSNPCIVTLLMTWHPYFSLYLLNCSVWLLLSFSTHFLSHTVLFHLVFVISQMIINKVLHSVHKNNIWKLACFLNSSTSLQRSAESVTSNITGNIDCCTIPKWNTNLHTLSSHDNGSLKLYLWAYFILLQFILGKWLSDINHIIVPPASLAVRESCKD